MSHRQIYGLPPSVFQNKDSPDYKPNYGKKFTERQLKILNEEIPIEEVRLTEISIIMRKAESLGDEENLDIARMLYAFKTHKEEYQFNISAEDAKRTIQDLTPGRSTGKNSSKRHIHHRVLTYRSKLCGGWKEGKS